MATKNINGIKTEKIDVTGSGDTWNLTKNAQIISADPGFNVDTAATNNTFNIDGSITAAYGIYGQAGKMTVNIGDTGSITGQIGILMAGTNQLEVDVDGEVHATQYAIQSIANKTTIDVGKNGSVEGAVGIYSTGTTRFTSHIDGDVSGYQYGVVSAAAHANVTVGKDASVDGGTYGIYLLGPSDGSVVNRGSITGGSGYAVSLGAEGEVRNFGDIDGLIGVYMTGDDGRVVNASGGSITATTYGIATVTNSGESARIINHGLVATSEAGYAIVGGDGVEKITNDGTIIGKIMLDGGDDRLDLRGGTVKGQILGGDGNDTLITDKASHKLVELTGEGTADTVQSSVTYKLSAEVERLILTGNDNTDGTGNDIANILRGNNGDNVLKGMAGMDDLFGGKGTDKLFGGDDADTFHFATGNGNDTIVDFVTTVDEIDLSGWNAITNFTQLKNHAENDGDGNVVITAGKDSLTIHDMVKNDLDMNDFSF